MDSLLTCTRSMYIIAKILKVMMERMNNIFAAFAEKQGWYRKTYLLPLGSTPGVGGFYNLS